MNRIQRVMDIVFLLLLTLTASAFGETGMTSQNVVVYREPGRFAGWPANHGIWAWGDEIVVGFESGYFRKGEGREHAIDYSRPADHLLARSLDGGESWSIEAPESLKPPAGGRIAGVPTREDGKQPVECPGQIPFTHPDFAMTLRMESIHVGPSRFNYSTDRGKTWAGPFKVPNFGQKGIAARTDYLVNGPESCLVFLTAAKSNGREGRVICVRTTDGGKTWNLVSYVTPEPEGRDHAIMPSTVRLSPKTLLSAVRYRKWIETFRSDDDGESWYPVNRPFPQGDNPASMIRLRDGRLTITYGVRQAPFGIRARLSSDDGQTWGKEIILRSDGGCWDLGYPRTVERPDGKIVTVYYFNEAPDQERYIGATIWDPGSR